MEYGTGHFVATSKQQRSAIHGSFAQRVRMVECAGGTLRLAAPPRGSHRSGQNDPMPLSRDQNPCAFFFLFSFFCISLQLLLSWR
ncbi:hypothetical protein BJX68DRAFT_231868 [Aspergillus pseudodeflectus]|uniref:Uncharacterized protein n=1 Tax=Aspergillus pseudodeflectus TaxID=176178 RepID=A0ABR4KQH7_9EURO